MTQEDKDLLLKDLCSRLPYKVIVDYGYNAFNVHKGSYVERGTKYILDCYLLDVFISPRQNEKGEYIKPYLFPLSSMTEEQKEELFKLCEFCTQEDWEGKKSEVYAIEIASRFDPAYCYDHNFHLWNIDMRAIDWLNKNHIDFRGLIEKGLAIDATGLNIY